MMIAIASMVRELNRSKNCFGLGIGAAELGKLAQLNQKEALTFWKSYGKQLGAGLASLIYVLTPEAIVIGAGVISNPVE